MFEDQYNEEMETQIRRMEAKNRALACGHPEWANACASCGRELKLADPEQCEGCRA